MTTADPGVLATPPEADEPEDVSIEDSAGLLRYLAARMFDATDGASARVARAKVIVRGEVTRSEVIAHAPGTAFLADPALRALTEDGPGGHQLFVNVVELRIERWIAGAGGKATSGVWVSPAEMTSESVTLPLVASNGVVLLDALPATPLGRELGKAVAGAYAIMPVSPIVLPDDDGAVTAAVAFATHPSAAGTKLLRDSRGGALQVVLGAIVRATDAASTPALRARVAAGAGDLDTVLVRAALYRRGDHASALTGLEFGQIASHVLQPLGIISLNNGAIRLGMTGPTEQTPLPW